MSRFGNRSNTNERMSRKKNFDSERMLVAAAALSPVARERLRKSLRPYVAKAIREYMERQGIPTIRRDELIAVGMEPFDRVFNTYLTHRSETDHEEEEGYFYRYYIWWMRQAVVAFLYPEK
uniref:Uncharacterized protein n=1 Tax=mine drainage metagenome TaxID=410659 RepID=E6Q5R4_9ZZZZ